MSDPHPLDKWSTPQGRRLRLRLFERDRAANAPCIWCGAPIDYSLGPYRRGGNMQAWSPEHVLPRSKHPELALDAGNIRASHHRCNVARGTRAGLTNLGQPSRQW